MKRSLSVPSGASWIVKAGEVLPQALIPDHEKLALKAEAGRRGRQLKKSLR